MRHVQLTTTSHFQIGRRYLAGTDAAFVMRDEGIGRHISFFLHPVPFLQYVPTWPCPKPKN
jgi:hypothetical protein